MLPLVNARRSSKAFSPWIGAAAGSLSFAVACAPAERPHGARAPVSTRAAELPGPAPRGRTADEAHALNATCEACHGEIASEWRASLHARAHTDPVYQRAFAIEPLAFCQGCHAPEAHPEEPVPDAAATLGVACVTCHVLENDVVAASRERSTVRGAAPHPVVRDGRLGVTTACSGCHEFAFPDRGARSRPELMQATVSEHARSLERDRACSDCHMPVIEHGGGRHRSHAFLGGRDPELVRSAVSVTAKRSSGGKVLVTLAPQGIGHAFPTGDLFRRVEVSAESVGAEWQVIGSARRYLARHWERDPRSPFGVVLRTAVLDDRPLGERVEVELELGERMDEHPIEWRVAYQRVEHPRSDDEDESVVESEVELAAGSFPAASGGTER